MKYATVKELAQNELMTAMQIAFERISDTYNLDIEEMTSDEKENFKTEMSRQFARVENLFGYEKYSWRRGC